MDVLSRSIITGDLDVDEYELLDCRRDICLLELVKEVSEYDCNGELLIAFGFFF